MILNKGSVNRDSSILKTIARFHRAERFISDSLSRRIETQCFKWKNGNKVGTTIMDLAKAFDTSNCNLLLSKL